MLLFEVNLINSLHLCLKMKAHFNAIPYSKLLNDVKMQEGCQPFNSIREFKHYSDTINENI